VSRSTRFVSFSLPVVLLFALWALWEAGSATSNAIWSKDAWFWTHVGFLVIALSGLLMAVLSALFYLWQSSRLKAKKVGPAFFNLPALDVLEKIHFRALAVGVVFFSLGILSGLFWASDLRELGNILRDPKVALSFLTCFLYWGVMSVRLSSLRRGQKIAAGTLIVFVLLLATFVSSYYMPSVFHRGL
jgi:ABC-type uncharacterized transport system permease subunit